MILDKYHNPEMGVLAPPYICARVFGLKFAQMHKLELWESNYYQMMLRCIDKPLKHVPIGVAPLSSSLAPWLARYHLKIKALDTL